MRVPAQKTLSPEKKLVIPKPERLKRKFNILLWIKRFFFFVCLAAIAFVIWSIASIPKRFNVLIIGSDQRSEERGRSDVLMVLSLTKNPADPASLITIPRDTRVEVPGYGMQKITHAYSLGTRDENSILGNAALTQQTIEQFLGVRIDGTAEVTFKSFKEIIDDVGGVVMKEYGKIDGEKALEIVRDRFRPGGDFARTEDQRELFMELAKTIIAKGAMSDVYQTLAHSQESRLSLPVIRGTLFAAYAVIRRGGAFLLKDIHNDVIPGHGENIYTQDFQKELYYWVPDTKATNDLVAQWLL